MAAMICAAASPISAAEETATDPQTDETAGIETETESQTASGEVWAMLSEKTELKQMKVTVPIRLHFAIMNSADKDSDPNLQFQTPHKENYKITVDKDSTVGVKVTKVNFEKPQNGSWSLNVDADAVKQNTEDSRLVAIKLNNDWMKLGENVFTTPLKVAPNEAKILPFDGQASQKEITKEEGTGIYEKAFQVTYTLEMDE